MRRHSFLAAGLAVSTALPVAAEQFALRLEEPYRDANAGLIATLNIAVIDRFSDGGAHYLVLDAPDAAHVEAFVYALGNEALTLNRVEANWAAPAFAELPQDQRLRFLRPIACEFCAR